MKFQLAILAPVLTLLFASTGVVATNTATTCVSNCFKVAAASVGCAASNFACVKGAKDAFEASVQACLAADACTSLVEGTQAEFEAAADTIALRTALLPDTEFDGMLTDDKSTVLSRVVPRSSLTERACNSGSSLCVLSSSRCNTYCQRCHDAGSGRCSDCSEGICAGFLGLTCVCQTPCRSC